MSKFGLTFIEKCLNGESLYEDIDDYVDIWHHSETNNELYEFLGMTEQEYELWLRYPHILPQIITAHKENINIKSILNQDTNLSLAAGQPHEIKSSSYELG